MFMASLKEIKSFNPQLSQYQRARELGCSNSTLQRYRKNINKLSSYRIPTKYLQKKTKDVKNKPR